MRILIVLLLIHHLTPAAWAKAKPRPHAKYTLQFIYYVERNENDHRPQSSDYPAVRAWLATQDDNSFPKEFRMDLNGDGRTEMFLRVLEHGRFAEYTIFTSRGGRWVHLGYGAYSDPPVRLKRVHSGWHDFSVDISGPRERVERRYFRWDPKDRTYDFSYSIEVRPMELDASEIAR